MKIFNIELFKNLVKKKNIKIEQLRFHYLKKEKSIKSLEIIKEV